MKRKVLSLALAFTAAAITLMIPGCDSQSNLDVREAAFPSAQSISLKYGGEVYGYGETISLSAVINEDSAYRTITLVNRDASNSISLGTIAVTETANYAIDSGITSDSILASGSTTFKLRFAATALGTVNAVLSIPYTVSGRLHTFTVNLAGTCTETAASTDDSLRVVYGNKLYPNNKTIIFPDVSYASKAVQSIGLYNISGSNDIAISSITSSAEASEGFTIDIGSMEATLGAGSDTAFSVTAFPTAIGSASTVLTIHYAIGSTAYTFDLTVQVTRTSPGQSIQLISESSSYSADDTLTLPTISLGSSETQTVTVKNIDSSATLSLGTPTLSTGSDFSLTTGSLSSSLAASGESSFSVKYTPTATGSDTATLTIPYTIYGTSMSFAVTLEGTCTAAKVAQIVVLDPDSQTRSSGGASYDFGYATGGAAITKTFTVKNTGEVDLSITSLYSDNSSYFTISSALSSTTIAAGDSETFSVKLSSSAASKDAVVTIVSNSYADGTFTISLTGGGSTIPATLTGDVGHLLDGHGYDFGYCSSSTKKTLSFVYSGTATLTLDTPTLDTGTSYTVSSWTTSEVSAGQSFSVAVNYSPSSTAWASDSLNLGDGKGRTYAVALTGSGFLQPGDLSGGVPTLWLRADRIMSSNTVYLDSKYKVDTWPDCRGNGLAASAINYNSTGNYLRPVYNSSGINGLPSLTFSGTTYTDHLQVLKSGGFLTTTSGTATFIAFKTASALDATRYIISCYYTDYANEVFPRLEYEQRYIDTADGFYNCSSASNTPLIIYPFATYGYGAGTTRHVIDTPAAWSTGYTTKTSTAYAVSLKFDVSKVSPAANMFMWVNGTAETLGYLYTNSTSYASTSAGSGYGAFGLPVGNGTGSINPTISGDSTYQYDYAYTLKASSANHTYFYNRLTTTVNTNIAVLNIGASNSSTANFKGEIAEIVMFPRALSDAEVTAMNNYLMYKYGISN